MVDNTQIINVNPSHRVYVGIMNHLNTTIKEVNVAQYSVIHGQHHPEWKILMDRFANTPAMGLEVGCLEGYSTVWFLQNVLNHPDSRMTVVDPFDGGIFYKERGDDFSQVYQNFLDNTEAYRDKITIHRGNSDVKLQCIHNPVNFIYIDGCHTSWNVLYDSCVCWRLLKFNGILIWDDYEWRSSGHGPVHEPKLAIDAFLACHEGQYKLLHKGWQVIVEKTI